MQATMQISVTNGIVKQAKHRLKVAQTFKSNLYRDQIKIKKEYSVFVGCVRQAPFSNVLKACSCDDRQFTLIHLTKVGIDKTPTKLIQSKNIVKEAAVRGVASLTQIRMCVLEELVGFFLKIFCYK